MDRDKDKDRKDEEARLAYVDQEGKGREGGKAVAMCSPKVGARGAASFIPVVVCGGFFAVLVSFESVVATRSHRARRRNNNKTEGKKRKAGTREKRRN